jgi:hypothetical protein
MIRIVARAGIALACGLGLAVSGCTGDGSGTTASSPEPGPTNLPVFHSGEQRPIAAGNYVTTAPDGFFPGLGLKLPDGWTAGETDSGEISLRSADRPDDVLLLWKDVVAVTTNNRKGTVGSVLDGVDSSPDAIVKWLTRTSDFKILAKPTSVIVGDGIKGVQLTLTTSKTANFGDKECPDNPRCSALFKDTSHWGEEFYAIGGEEVSQIFVAALPYPGDAHTLWIVLDAPNATDLVELAAEAKPIIDSLQLPATYVLN